VSDILKFDINCTFTILTFKKNFERAEELSEFYSISDKTILKYIEPSELDSELVKHNIGIIVRDNNLINETASPFKIVDYISNGLALLVTDSISWQAKQIISEDYYFTLKYSEGDLFYNKAGLRDFILDNIENNNSEKIKKSYKDYLNSIERIIR